VSRSLTRPPERFERGGGWLAVSYRHLALAALALLAGAVLAFLLLRDGQPSPGPLRGEEDSRLSGWVRTNRDFMFGVPVVRNHGDEPAVLERATFVRPTPGLRIERTLVAGPRREANYIADSAVFPPTFSPLRDVHPLPGYRVLPRTEPGGERGVELVFVLRVRRPGRYAMSGVQLEYSVGGTEHRRILPNSYAACAVPPGARLGRRCPLPPLAAGEL
jgi:hypothetical protein